ncbi:MAG: DoxX family protein [Bacteroidales bacterium]|jgi:uncharacterized membrane protein YphA (DoxX/SURF4 family)|nr:DoxX family protein [Bacteroidales bacterium]
MRVYGQRNVSKKPKPAMYYIYNFSRIFIGLLFIFSGYVKMVDPYGFALKFEEYFISFGMDFMTPIAMVFAFLLNCAEFLLGCALLLNIQIRLTSWGLLLFMMFFTVLTAWLAYAQNIVAIVNNVFDKHFEIFVVTDCGCFGDFIKLTNHETFYKNIVFMFFTIIIFSQRNKQKPQQWYYITQWLPLLLVAGFSLFVQIHCLRHEPWHDFRPWKVGNFIAGETYSQAPVVDYVFQYKNNTTGSIKEITMEELSLIAEDSIQSVDLENNYTWHDRIEKIIQEGINAPLADFTITDIRNKNDIKNNIITSPNYTFIIFMRDVREITPEKFEPIRNLIRDLDANNWDYIVITGSLLQETEMFNKENNTDIYFYFSDITPLKTAIRNNPGVILIKQGYVIDKWSFRDIPSIETIKASIPEYDEDLEKYKKKHPPLLPDGRDIMEITAGINNETVAAEDNSELTN